jgi:hypothetical protein
LKAETDERKTLMVRREVEPDIKASTVEAWMLLWFEPDFTLSGLTRASHTFHDINLCSGKLPLRPAK